VSFGVFAILFVGGASVLAAWTFARFPRIAPRDLRTALMHLGGSLLAGQVVSPFAGSLTASSAAPVRLGFVLGVALPALWYTILSFIWLLALVQAAIRRGSLQ
jgi:hypothetical protein